MADGTKIEWTEATWNPITGCSVVSPGCTNCYAMQLAGTRLAEHPSRKGLTRDTKAGPVWTGEVRFNEQWLDQPLRWRRPRMVFVCAHGDLFHESVPDEWLDRVFGVMALAPQHTFQVLTKRIERACRYIAAVTTPGRVWSSAGQYPENDRAYLDGLSLHGAKETDLPPWPLRNVWLGVSVEDQARADERIPVLLDTPAAVRWISAEPLLGPVDLTALPHENWRNRDGVLDALSGHDWVEVVYGPSKGAREICATGPNLDWVVIGGESGRDARKMDMAWARSLVAQCRSAGVAVFVKQLGQLTIDGPVQRLWRHSKGGDPAEWPEDLRVREWPRG